MVKINKEERQELCRHAIDEYPNECCGILLGNRKSGSVRKVYRARNVAEIERQNMHFLMNPLELYRVEKEAEKNNMEIVGFYHSHADHPAELSRKDCSFMIQGYMYMIVSVIKGICRETKCFMKINDQSAICEIKGK